MSDPTAPLTSEQVMNWRDVGTSEDYIRIGILPREWRALCNLALTALRAQQAQPVAQIGRGIEGLPIVQWINFDAKHRCPVGTKLYLAPVIYPGAQPVHCCGNTMVRQPDQTWGCPQCAEPPPRKDWPEEAKARLDHALFGATDKPAAWIRADGRLFATEAEAKFNPVYTAHALFLSPQAQTRREVVEECIRACEGEHLTDPTKLPDDVAYDCAINDCVAALYALAPAIQETK